MTRNPGETIFLAAVLAALAAVYLAVMPPGLSSSEEAVPGVSMPDEEPRHEGIPRDRFAHRRPRVAVRKTLRERAGSRVPWRQAPCCRSPRSFPGSRAFYFYPLAQAKGPSISHRCCSCSFRRCSLGLVLDRLMRRDLTYSLLLAVFLLGSPVFMQGMHGDDPRPVPDRLGPRASREPFSHPAEQRGSLAHPS